MTLPVEDFIAAFPPSVRAGAVELGPMTLEHAVLFGAFDIPLDEKIPVPAAKVPTAAMILSSRRWGRVPGELDFRRFARRLNGGQKELAAAVESCRSLAMSTYIAPRPAEGETRRTDPHGLGWPLEIAEFLCGEYGWGWQVALETPCATAHALVAACRQRYGGLHGDFDYVERARSQEVHSRKERARRAAEMEVR